MLDVYEINAVLKFLDFDTKIQYFIFRQYLCIVVLNWVTFILYSSFIIRLEGCFSWHTSCLFTHDVTILRNWHRVHSCQWNRCYVEIICTEIQYFIS